MKRRGFFGWIAALFSGLLGRTDAEPWSVGTLARTPAEDMVPVRVAAMVQAPSAYDMGPFRGYPNTLALYDMSALSMTLDGAGNVVAVADCSPNAYECRRRDL